jgi:hypothetical protein
MNLNQISNTLIIAGMALAFQAFGAPGPVLTDVGTAVAVEKANSIDVPIFGEVTMKLGDDKPIALTKTGYGQRIEKLGVLKAPMYVMESFVDNKNPLDAEKPLESLQKASVKALRLTITFPLTAGQLRQSFSKGLKRNGVNLEKQAIKALLESIKTGLTPRQVATFVSVTKGNVDDVYITMPNEVLHESSEKLGNDFWSIWFGIVKGDDYLTALKPQLIKR